MDMNEYDKEVVELCKAMNLLPGITTIESCCGHGKRPYHIWFTAEGLLHLPRLIYYFDVCHCGFGGWRVIAHTDCGMSPAVFLVEGPVGEDAYWQSEAIAQLLRREMGQT
ncbi:MAG: hypothetical protein PHV98_00875 [Candidatus Omnitrophica bacterium]|nr:hypothetical protein [Candidatus Omnitrophota bacterium]